MRALNIRTPKEAIYFANAVNKRITETKDALDILTKKINQTPQLAKIYRAISSSPDNLNREELFLSLKGSNAYSSDDEIKQNIKLYYEIQTSREYLKNRLNELKQDYFTVKNIEETLIFLKSYMNEISEVNKQLLSYCHSLREEDYNLLSEYCNEHYSDYEDFLFKKYNSLDKKIADAKTKTTTSKNKGITRSLEANR